ncbi:MAG: CHAT domain-containing protein [Armatimonadetes bacterium]|nr:CHAT domain-containing protein [Armatimonadota bacterium]
MARNDWIDALSGSGPDAEVRRLLPRPMTSAHAEEAFLLTARALGESQVRARRLAGRWKLFSRQPECRPWSLRLRALSERLDGQWAKSATSFRLAGQACSDPVSALKFQVGAVDSLGRAGKVRQAVVLAGELEQGLSAAGETSVAALVCLNLGNALLWHDRYSEARSAFAKALGGIGPEGEMLPAALLGAATSELYGGDPRTARSLASEAVAKFQDVGADSHAAQALVTWGRANLMLGHPDEALERFRAAQRLFDPSSADAARAEEFIGDAYFRMNLWSESAHAYGQALSHPTAYRPSLNRGNARLGMATALEMSGRTVEAERWARLAAADFKSFGNDVWYGYAAVVRARLFRKSGRADRGLFVVSSALKSLQERRVKGLIAEAALEQAEALIANGRDPRSALSTASRSLAARPDPDPMWRLHALRARTASPKASLVHYRKAVKAVFDARALAQSSLARSNFLNDKNDVVREFLGRLLTSGRPEHAEEAYEVVRESRSSVLLDEILSSQDWKDAPWRAELETLREAFGTVGFDNGESRTRRALPQDWSDLNRRWTDVMLATTSRVRRIRSKGRDPDWTFVDTSEGPFLLTARSQTRLPDVSTLERQVSWARFELLAPLVDRCAPEGPALEALEGLARSLGVPKGGHGTVVCPDGPYWSVPWSALPVWNGQEPVIALGPWVSKEDVTLPSDGKVALWFHAPTGLPYVRAEVESFLGLFPDAEVCTTAQEARRCLDGPSIGLLHIAGHASSHPEHPMFSSVHFADGAVSAAEISRSNLRPEIVVMSACETGTLSTQRPAEPEGLARSFLSRGSRAVVTSFWPLDDHAASIFMYPFCRRLLDGGTVLDAVRSGRQTVRDRYPHPYFWGPFTLYGGY